MLRHVEPPDPVKQSLKRAREDDPETTVEPERQKRRLETSPSAHSPAQQGKPLPEASSEASPEPLLPTPTYSVASPKHHAQSASHSHQKHHTVASEPALEALKQSSKRRRLKRQLDEPPFDPPTPKRCQRSAPPSELQPVEPQPAKQQDNWFIDHWQSKTAQEPAAPGTLEGQQTLESGDLPPFEDNNSISSVEGPRDWQDEESDQMSQSQDAGSNLSEKLKIGRPIYRVALKMNKVTIDNDGSEIPREVEELVTRHIRKERTSPRLEDDKKAEILNAVKLVWDESESTLTDITALPILPFGSLHHQPPSLIHGGNAFWSRTPLPQNALFPLVTPKTDKHLGYPNSLISTWTPQELMAVVHPTVRPYSQPTTSNVFPSFLCEVKSEATGGTLYAAEAQLATAGFHRVKSMIWILDQIDPQRTRKSSDAIIFSAALSQRQLVAYVHYYDPASDIFRMSFVDNFYLFKELQGCMDFSGNVEDWMVNVQQPAVREAMRRLYPVTQLWTKGRSASVVAADDGASFGSDGDGDNNGGRTAKNARTE